MHKRLETLIARFPQLEACAPDIQAAFEAMVKSYRAGGKLLLCGNGGSAADCEHWAGELLKGFGQLRPLSPKQKEGLDPAVAERLQQALPCIPLTGFVSLTTAFNNDVDPQLTFAQLAWGLANAGDVLVGMTTSGNSRNVIEAVKVAKAKGVFTIGMTGQGGGQLASLCDLCLKAPATETYLIQEFHLPIYHALCLMLEDEFFG